MFLIYPDANKAVGSNEDHPYTAFDTYIDVTDQYAGGNAPKIYIIGNVNQTGWQPYNGIEMTTEDGVNYWATIDFLEAGEGYSYFGLTTRLAQSWDDINGFRFGAPSDGYLVSSELYNTDIACTAPSTNSFKVRTGMYRIYLHLPSRTIVVEPITPPVYVLGDVEGYGWAANMGFQMTHQGDDLYTAIVDFAENFEGNSYFSFTTELASGADDWDAIAPYRFGAPFDDYLINEDGFGTEINCSPYSTSSFMIPTGKYVLTLHRISKVLVVEPYDTMRGDLNGDGIVTLSDLTTLINLLRSGANIPTAHADCNRDNVVNSSDVTALVSYLLTHRW